MEACYKNDISISIFILKIIENTLVLPEVTFLFKYTILAPPSLLCFSDRVPDPLTLYY